MTVSFHGFVLQEDQKPAKNYSINFNITPKPSNMITPIPVKTNSTGGYKAEFKGLDTIKYTVNPYASEFNFENFKNVSLTLSRKKNEF